MFDPESFVLADSAFRSLTGRSIREATGSAPPETALERVRAECGWKGEKLPP